MSSLQLPMVFATFFLQFLSGVYSSTFTTRNKCSYPVWPAILSGAGTTFASPCKCQCSGNFLCPGNFPCSCNFPCLTEDDGYSTMASSGGGAAPPATLVEFTLNGAGGLDFYDVSFVDPMMVAQHGGTRYAANLNKGCPVELKIIDGNSEGAADKSGSNAFRDPRYCCGGACTSWETCKPSSCSEFFKNACPQACSHSYDHGSTSTFTCVGADDIITFCPDLCTRLILIANAAEKKPCTYKKFPAETEPFPAETKPCANKKSPAETEPFSAEAKPRSHVVHVLLRNRRLLGKLPDVNVHSPPSTSNKQSWNLEKEDPPSPPAPSGNQPIHN